MKPNKFSTGYLTPQTKRNKTESKLKRSESNECLNFKFGEVNEDVLKKLLSCPIKKQLIVNLITSEKDKIEAYKKKLEKQNDLSMSSPIQKLLKKPCGSPTALLRRRLEQQKHSSANRDSDSGSSTCSRPESRQSMASTVPSPVSFEKILDGVIAFVEVRSGERDRSDGVKAILTSMGATIRDKFTRDITHVIFKDGSFTTYQKANLVRSKLVSVLWLEACKSSGIRVPEKNYPAIGAVGSNIYDHNQTVLCSQMQKDYEDIIREEFNRSISVGEPLPSAKSVINKRRTIMTPNVSMANAFPNTSQVDSRDKEVANIMRRTIHGPFNNPESPESPVDNQSDTGPIIDGDTDDIIDESNIYEIQQKTSTVPEDMDLTDLQGVGFLENSKENTCPRKSTNLYNKKTPKINKTAATHHITNSESPSLFDSIYKRKTELFDNKTSPIISQKKAELNNASNTELTPRTLRIFSKNATIATPIKENDGQAAYFKNVDELISVLQPPDKTVDNTTSTTMSSLRVSNNTDKTNSNVVTSSVNNSFISKNSFSPLELNVISNIIQQLDDDHAEKDKVTTRKKQDKNNVRNKRTGSLGVKERSSSIENSNIDTPQIHSKRLFSENVTLRKKYTGNNRELTEDDSSKTQKLAKKALNFASCSDDDDKKQDENLENPRLTVNLRTRRKRECCLSCDRPDKAHDELELPKNRRKTIHISKTVGNQTKTTSESINTEETDKETKVNKRRQTENRRKTIASIITQEVDHANTSPKKKLRLSEQKVEKTASTNKSSDKQPNEDAQKTEGTTDKNRRRTIASSTKNRTNSKNIRTRRSLSASKVDADRSPKSGSEEKKKRTLRKLYDPYNLLIPDNSDDQERDAKRKAKKRNSSGVFIKPSTIFSSKSTDSTDKSPDESPVQPPKTQTKNKQDVTKNTGAINSDEDEQVDLKNWISNKKDENADGLRRTSRNLTKNKKANTQSTSQTKKRKPSQAFKQPSIPSTPRNTIKSTIKHTPITPLRNRRSTLDFQSAATVANSRHKLKIDKAITPSIVCTKLHAEDVLVFKQIVNKLGRFNVEDEVSSKTTHLVAGEPKRTINMLRAVAMGCWVLKKEWLFSSLESGRWLPEEDFEETRFSPAVQKSRLQRQAFGPSYTMDMFQDCGLICIARGSIPRCSDLQELVILCKGKVTRVSRSAKIVVGEYVKYDDVICVSETWLLDCITFNKLVPFKKYIIKPDR